MKTLGEGSRRSYWIYVVPALVLVAILYAYPVLRVLWLSVTEPEPGLGNYGLLLTSEAVHNVIITTLRICLITSGISLVAGYLVAYGMTHVKGRQLRWMLFCVLLTFWLSTLMRAFAWVIILRTDGVLNSVLQHIGLEPLNILYSEAGVIIGMVHYMLPYAIFPLYANMRGIDSRLVSAARGLGASPAGAFVRVFLPLSLPGIVGAGLLVLVFSLGFFVTPAILGGGKVTMVAEYISYQVGESLRWGLATMLATSLLVTVLLLFAVVSRFVNLRRLLGAAS
jgi:putative spermidine/putrescine transport system permease protein